MQYFSDFSLLMDRLQLFLKENGEIHILDSPFYSANRVEKAQNRTLKYYTKIGFPEMASNYFHQTKNDIKKFEILYQPRRNRLN